MSQQEIKGWLTGPYDYERPSRGQILQGTIIQVSEQGISIDVGLKRDGFVPNSDIERLEQETDLELEPGQEVKARVMRLEDRNGNLVLSLTKALSEQDWDRAEEMLASGQVWEGEVEGYNRGGLLIKFGRLRGFVPGSHLWEMDQRRLSPDQRKKAFQEYVGRELALKVIEVDRARRRLVMSERLARRQMREQARERLLNELEPGQVVQGVVSHLTQFGAFVDLGGADGLVHISELSWRRVKHPREAVQLGDEIQVHVLRLDRKRKRIALSLKRLQPNPWDWIDLSYLEGQLASGVVTNVVDFGVFVALEAGVEGLVHVSELSDPPPDDPRMVVQVGDELVLRILDVDSARQRIGLSLKRVADWEREAWLARQQESQEKEADSSPPSDASDTHQPTSDNGQAPLTETDTGQEMGIERIAENQKENVYRV